VAAPELVKAEQTLMVAAAALEVIVPRWLGNFLVALLSRKARCFLLPELSLLRLGLAQLVFLVSTPAQMLLLTLSSLLSFLLVVVLAEVTTSQTGKVGLLVGVESLNKLFKEHRLVVFQKWAGTGAALPVGPVLQLVAAEVAPKMLELLP
jgi:hypothetical protein